jgi:hypothetical protein
MAANPDASPLHRYSLLVRALSSPGIGGKSGWKHTCPGCREPAGITVSKFELRIDLKLRANLSALLVWASKLVLTVVFCPNDLE